MNYRKVYMAIIAKAIKENRKKLSRDAENYVYYEAHHILPKSLFPNWRRRKSNLVLLTPREHYICHMCATKIWPTKEMACAFMMMCNSSKNSIMYSISRENYSKYFSGEGNPMYGRSAIREMSDEQFFEYRQKMSKILSNIRRDENWKNHISIALKGKSKSNSHRKKMIETLDRVRPMALQKAAEAHKGKHWFNNGKKNVLALECPKGFSVGKIQKELDEVTKATVRLAQSNFGKGKHWFNNGKENFFGFDCPDGYVAGKLHKEYKKTEKKRKDPDNN